MLVQDPCPLGVPDDIDRSSHLGFSIRLLVEAQEPLHSMRVLLLMMDILHDFIYQSPGHFGNVVYIG